MADTQFEIIRGKAYYAQVLGKARPNYNRDGTEWKIDLVPEEGARAKLRELGILDRLKRMDKEGHPAEGLDVIKLKRKGEDYEGNPRTGPKVVDSKQKPWPEDKLIGNGSDVFVRISVTPPKTKGYKAKVTLMGVLVKEYVPYESSGAERGMFDEVADTGGEEPWDTDIDE